MTDYDFSNTLLKRTEIGGFVDLELQRTPRRKARRARVSVRWAQVTLQPPLAHPGRNNLPSVPVQVVWAYEETPPTEKERVSWLLVTTLPVWDFERASEVLKSYTLRWLIERYHFCLKGACRVEQLQLSSAERLEKAMPSAHAKRARNLRRRGMAILVLDIFGTGIDQQ